MNNRKEPQFDDREWESQERGMRAARKAGPETGAMDAAAEHYRRVAMAMVGAPRSEPPADFVSNVVEQVALHDAGIERALFRGLSLVLAASSVIVAALYGGQWWQAMQEMLTGGGLQWVLAGSACAALSWMTRQLHQRADHLGG